MLARIISYVRRKFFGNDVRETHPYFPDLIGVGNQDVDNRLDFDPKSLILHYRLFVSSICHVGAHKGDEIPSYQESGIKKALFIEPLAENFEVLRKRLSEISGYDAKKFAVGSSAGEVTMYLSSNDLQSSSILMPNLHLTEAPQVEFKGSESVRMQTLDVILEEFGIPDFLTIDVQGYELEVLKGAQYSLKNCKYLFIEVNRAETYFKCAKIEEIDLFLSNYGLIRTLTRWWGSWGDAFYVKKSLLPLNVEPENYLNY